VVRAGPHRILPFPTHSSMPSPMHVIPGACPGDLPAISHHVHGGCQTPPAPLVMGVLATRARMTAWGKVMPATDRTPSLQIFVMKRQVIRNPKDVSDISGIMALITWSFRLLACYG